MMPIAALPSQPAPVLPATNPLLSPQSLGSSAESIPSLKGNSAEGVPALKPLVAEADFSKMNAEDLRIGDVTVLLAQYKKMLEERKRLRALLDQHGIKY